MKDNSNRIKAFQYWFLLTEKGHTTTEAIELTAKHIGKEPRTVWRWYTGLDWDNRAIEKRAKIMEEVEKKENKTLAENRISYLKILHKLLDDYIKAGLPSKIDSVKDLEIVIKNCLILQDAPSEVTKTDNVNINMEIENLFDEELMRKIVEEEKQLQENTDEEIILDINEDELE